MKLELRNCISCKNKHFLSAKFVQTTFDEDGKIQTEESDLLENLIIDSQTHEALKGQW